MNTDDCIGCGMLNKENDGLTKDLNLARARIRILEKALYKCGAHAGHPDAAEGCRLVIRTVEVALGLDDAPEA